MTNILTLVAQIISPQKLSFFDDIFVVSRQVFDNSHIKKPSGRQPEGFFLSVVEESKYAELLFLPNLRCHHLVMASENNEITAFCQICNIDIGFADPCSNRYGTPYLAIDANDPDVGSMTGDRTCNRNRGIARDEAGIYMEWLGIAVVERNNRAIVD